MENKSDFTIYNEKNTVLRGRIENGCLHLESAVYGDDHDSEKYYVFTKEDTNKLFSVITFDNFIMSCREGHLMWLEDFLKKIISTQKPFATDV